MWLDARKREREEITMIRTGRVLIIPLELIDIQIMDRRFTWSNLRENLSLAKLGRIIVSSYWESIFS